MAEANLMDARLLRAKLKMTSLESATLMDTKFHSADLRDAALNLTLTIRADFKNADLSGASLMSTSARWAKFVNANLMGADLRYGNFTGCDFRRAMVTGANLENGTFTDAIFDRANLGGCRVYGASAWNVQLLGTVQKDLIITPENDTTITVDNLEVAQFIYLLLNNEKIRNVIDTITSKVVLILGRFTPERKAILDAIRNELRKRDYLPVLFDFEKPSNRDITEAVSTLAHMARFVIADITGAKSIPQELMRIVPALPSVPVQPLLLVSEREFGMFEHFRRFPWVLEPLLYEDQEGLLAVLTDKVIRPAEAMVQRQTGT